MIKQQAKRQIRRLTERERGKDSKLLNLSPWIWISVCCCCCSVAKLRPTLCDLRDCNPPGSSVHGILQARTWRLPFPSPGDLSDPGIKSETPAWQADSLPLSHQGCQGRCPLYQEFGVLPTLPEFMSYSNISRSHFALKLQNMYIQWGFLPDSKSLLISNTESAHSCKTPPNKSQRQGLTSSGEFLKVACFNSDCCLPGELRRIVSQDVPRAL